MFTQVYSVLYLGIPQSHLSLVLVVVQRVHELTDVGVVKTGNYQPLTIGRYPQRTTRSKNFLLVHPIGHTIVHNANYSVASQLHVVDQVAQKVHIVVLDVDNVLRVRRPDAQVQQRLFGDVDDEPGAEYWFGF